MRNEDGAIAVETIVRRGVDMLAALDPAGAQLMRGIQLLLVIALSALAAWQIANYLGVPDSASIPIIAPVVGGHAMLFTVPTRRAAEVVSIIKLTGIALLAFGLAAVAGWGDWGMGNLPASIAWIPAIALCFYLHRYGGPGVRTGTMLALMFLFVAVFNPGRIDAMWWLLAAVIGAAAAMLVSLLSWRPRVEQAFDRQRDRFVQSIVDKLKLLRASAVIPPDERPVHDAWERLALASDLAGRTLPEQRQRNEQTLASALRMLLAVKIVIDDSTDLVRVFAPDSAPDSAPTRALDDTIETLLTPNPSESAITERIESLRSQRDAVVTEHDKPMHERFEGARMMIGLLRILLSFREFVANQPDADATGAEATTPRLSGGVGADEGNAFGLRLALQATVAACITTAIGVIFNLEHAYWATLTVIIVISATLGATVRRTLERSIGTAIGVVVAMATMWLVGDDRTVLILLAVIAFVPMLVLIERYYAIAAGLIGFSVVIGLHLIIGLTEAESLSRIYDTVIGAGVGLAVAGLLVPARSSKNLHAALDAFRDHSREALRHALAGQTSDAAAAGPLQKDAIKIAAELTNIESERLFARGAEIRTRRLQAYSDNLALYVALLASTLERLAGTTLPKTDKALLNDLIDDLSAYLDVSFDRPATGVDVKALTDRWAATVELDKSMRPRDDIWLIEALVYGRKCFDTIDRIR
ncbi:MAG: FUSC family protein, partial [Pseudomonadota bacterium]